MDQRGRALLEAPILPTLARLAWPGVVLALVQASVSFADMWFVGRLGTDALASIALVFPLIALMQMMSAGAIGGGVASSIARALGAGDTGKAGRLAMHALAIGIAFGLLFAAIIVLVGPSLYAMLGGSGASLAQAVAYSNVVFGGAIAVWLCNTLASILRGTGDMTVPAFVLGAAAAVQIPLCGALVLGWGALPALGIIGAGIAYVGSFGLAGLCLAGYLVSGRGALALRWRGHLFSAALFSEILGVGLLSSLNAVLTVATTAIVTGLVGAFGTAALAGYGLGVRLELLQIPVVFAIGSALVAMVGTNIGAGNTLRARRVAWTGAALAACVTGSVGMVVAVWPSLWAGMFSDDPAVLAAGYAYLRIAGPCYAFLGLGVALYFASQGARKVLGPVMAGVARFVIAALGGVLLVRYFAGTLDMLFGLIAFAMFVFGAGAAAAVKYRVFRQPSRS